MKILIDNYSKILDNSDMCLLMGKYMKSVGHDVYLDSEFMPIYYKMSTFAPDWYFTSTKLFSDDMLNYIANNSKKTLFIIHVHQTIKLADLIKIQSTLDQLNARYKLLINNNFGNAGYILGNTKTVINFCEFQTDCLQTDNHNKWNKSFDFILVGEYCNVDLQVVHRLRDEGFKFHTQVRHGTKGTELTLPINEYKEILCNYKYFVFYDNRKTPLGETFYNICSLKKPVYLLSNNNKKTTAKSLGVDIDISFDNKENDINFDLLYDSVSTNFSLEKQVDKIILHLPKK